MIPALDDDILIEKCINYGIYHSNTSKLFVIMEWVRNNREIFKSRHDYVLNLVDFCCMLGMKHDS